MGAPAGDFFEGLVAAPALFGSKSGLVSYSPHAALGSQVEKLGCVAAHRPHWSFSGLDLRKQG